MKKIIVAGPCSAESREQVMATAAGLHKIGVEVFRAGVWKPRTRPGCFEGVGHEALEWLEEVRATFGMRVATEINCARNVEQLVAHQIDIAWIGARTSVSPFVVDEIAQALAGTGIEVYIKNPVCPDVELWMGAIERLRLCGIEKITAVHRGFSQLDNDIYRNAPLWSIPLRLMREMPDVPMVCDPSHISGRRAYVEQVSAMALSLGMQGLFMETHCNPDEALSDAAQQCTPDDTGAMLARLGLL